MMTKDELRAKYKKQRSIFNSQQVKWLSKDCCKQFLEHLDNSGAIIHTFLPIRKHNEVNMWHFVKKIGEQFPNVKFCTSTVNMKTGELRHYFFDLETEFKEDLLDIPIPKSIDEVKPSQIDIVLVPLLAYDKRGNRVGYGKGYYDKFLEQCNDDCEKIGVSFFPPEDELIPVEDTDIGLDACVNPNEVLTF
jgi:5-formyltetrahydrofolate cyclo-ligase